MSSHMKMAINPCDNQILFTIMILNLHGFYIVCPVSYFS
jgi:hypothetical protein